jgi:hypothetical protein
MFLPAGLYIDRYFGQAGMLAGEGIGGVFQALLAVVGVDGTSKCPPSYILLFSKNFSLCLEYGTAIGCPGFQFCG